MPGRQDTYCGSLQLLQCNPRARLPALYLMDSIIKNLKEPYITLFSKHIDLVSAPGAVLVLAL